MKISMQKIDDSELKDITIVQYLMNALENNYLESMIFNNVTKSDINITALVSNSARIRPTLMMIEANMYTKKELLAINVECLDSALIINTFNGIKYTINVKSISKH